MINLKEIKSELQSILTELELSVRTLDEQDRPNYINFIFVAGISYGRIANLYNKLRMEDD